MDITDADTVSRVVLKHKPDVIIHAAAMTQVDVCEQNRELCYLNNVTAVEYMIKGARDVHAHLVYVSTDFVFDGQKGLLQEEDAPSPVNYYGECKWLAEQRVMESSISWAIVRTVLVYGIIPGISRPNILTWVKKNLEEGKPIRVVNDQWRTPTLAEDLAYGCYLVASSRAQGIYHISGKDYVSVHDIAIRTAGFFNLDASLISPVSSEQLPQPARRPALTGFTIEKARRTLGYEPRSLNEGIAIVASQL
jgi:dTDP-4-dehydrorhamnose reductase